MVSCSRFIWIASYSDHRVVCTANLLHTKQLANPLDQFIQTYEIFTIFSWLIGYVEKQLDAKVNFNYTIYDLTDWTTNSYNIHILPNILRSKGNQTIKLSQCIKFCVRNIFFQKSCKNDVERLVPNLFLFFFKKAYIG